MSQLLRELRNLLVASQTVRGRVIAVANGHLRVATADGVVEVPVEPNVGVGDDVTIRNGGVSRLTSGAGAPLYFV